MATRILLNTAGRCASEMANIYRKAKKGEMEWADACSASLILHRLRQALDSGAVEERLAALEKRAEEYQANGDWRPPSTPNARLHRQMSQYRN